MKVPTLKELEAMSLEEVEAVRRMLEAQATELHQARRVVARIAEHKTMQVAALRAAAAAVGAKSGPAHDVTLAKK